MWFMLVILILCWPCACSVRVHIWFMLVILILCWPCACSVRVHMWFMLVILVYACDPHPVLAVCIKCEGTQVHKV